MKRIHAAWLGFLIAAIYGGNVYGQEGSTQIYGQPRAAVLQATADAPKSSPTTALDERSFPSLKPPSNDGERGLVPSEKGAHSSKMAAPTITVISSLAVVLGLFAALVWGSRRFGNGGIHKGSIPKEAIQPLGSTALDPRTRITLLRCGHRILVLAQTAGTTQTLCEITDPQEVHDLTATCQGSSKREFASTLRSIENEKTSGYLGPNHHEQPGTRRRLFASG